MGTVIQFPRERIVRERELKLSELSREIGYSRRWIQTAVNKPAKVGLDRPLPHTRRPNGHLRFTLTEVLAALDERSA